MSDLLPELGELAVSAAVPALARALRDPRKLTRIRAARFLAQLGPAAQPALSDLTECSHDADADVRTNCRAAIKAIGAK